MKRFLVPDPNLSQATRTLVGLGVELETQTNSRLVKFTQTNATSTAQCVFHGHIFVSGGSFGIDGVFLRARSTLLLLITLPFLGVLMALAAVNWLSNA